MLYKRGELTSEQLIGLILVTAGFLIILAFFTNLGTESYTSDQLCKFSVMSRATAEEVKAGTGSILPLQCTTSKICITPGGKGECSQFAGEKDVQYVRLPSFDKSDPNSITTAADEISRVSAESMYSCWNMMGQGKLDLFNSVSKTFGFSPFEKSTCVICTRVAVSDDVPDYVLARVNVSHYMKTHTATSSSSQTFLNAIGGDEMSNTFVKIDESKLSPEAALAGPNENPRELAFIFMQFKAEDISTVLKSQLQAETALASAAFTLSPSTALTFAFKGKTLVAMAAAAGIGAGAGSLGAWANQRTAVAYCGEFTTKESASKGCSVLQMVNYNVNDIRNMCGNLQGNP